MLPVYFEHRLHLNKYLQFKSKEIQTKARDIDLLAIYDSAKLHEMQLTINADLLEYEAVVKELRELVTSVQKLQNPDITSTDTVMDLSYLPVEVLDNTIREWLCKPESVLLAYETLKPLQLVLLQTSSIRDEVFGLFAWYTKNRISLNGWYLDFLILQLSTLHVFATRTKPEENINLRTIRI